MFYYVFWFFFLFCDGCMASQGDRNTASTQSAASGLKLGRFGTWVGESHGSLALA